MELVDDKKLEEVANFLTDIEVDGRFLCSYLNNSLKRNRIDVPCDTDLCEDTCPFHSKRNFIRWLKKPYRKLDAKGLKKPEQGDFIELDRFSEGYINSLRYAEALEKYCNELEKYCNELEKALDNACEYTHDCGSNGCLFNYDVLSITNKKMNECNMCDYQCISLDDELNSSKQQQYEYLKKSMKCWKEYFLKGDTEDGNK